MNYELYLFSKLYLYAFEEAKISNDHGLKLFTHLFIEYFLNPVTLVHTVNRSIDTMQEEMRRSNQTGSTPGKELFRTSKLMPLNMNEIPGRTQMLFIQTAVVILKDQWKNYLRHTVKNADNENLAFCVFSNLHKWFKVLLVERPNLIRGKLINIGCIYLTIITPDDMLQTNLLEEFISIEQNFSEKQVATPSFLERLTDYKSSSKPKRGGEYSLTLEKIHKGGNMDDD